MRGCRRDLLVAGRRSEVRQVRHNPAQLRSTGVRQPLQSRCIGRCSRPSHSFDRSMTIPANSEASSADTARLRGLGTFPRVQVLLGELITDQQLIPPGSRNVSNPDALPEALKASIQRAERQGRAWSAWSNERELFAVTADVDASSSRMHAKPVLRVLLYDGKGRVIGSSQWLEVRPTRWTTCES